MKEQLPNVTACTVTFDFRSKSIIYSVRMRRRLGGPSALRERLAENGLLHGDRVRINVRRTPTGKMEFTFNGPAIDHIYAALPVFGAPMTPSKADQFRRVRDSQLGTTTQLYATDLSRIVRAICDPGFRPKL